MVYVVTQTDGGWDGWGFELTSGGFGVGVGAGGAGAPTQWSLCLYFILP